MKNINELITELKEKRIYISLEKENIRVKSGNDKIPDDIIKIIKENKDNLIHYFKKEKYNHDIENIYPLSPMQEGLLFHALYSSGSEVYMNQKALDLVGQLDISAFKAAWQAIFDKHTILRTSFVREGVSKPLQKVHKSVKCNVELLDFTHFREEEIQTKLDTLLENDRTTGFDLTKAPLSKFKLIKISENKHRFIWTHHHILMDGWSLPILFKEFYDNYKAFRTGEGISVENIDKYEDFISYLEGQDKIKAKEFWKDYLKGFENPTPIGIGNTNQKADETDTYKTNSITLNIEDTKFLNAFSKEHHLTVNTLVQAAWSLLLNRYSGENDIVFGMTVSGRPASLPEVEEKVGLFINTLPLRVKIDDRKNVIEWLKEVQEQQPLLREYEYMPLTNIHSLTQVSNEENLFNSILAFENYPIRESDNTNNLLFKIENVQSFEKTNYPLSIVARIDSKLEINISYNNIIYSTEIIEQTLGHLREVLLNIIKYAKRPVSELEILTPLEKHKLLVEWNDTAADYPKDKCIHELFEEQVKKTPDNVAVVFEKKELTYQQLNKKSNQLANYLQSKGVKPDSLVGICVDRSLEMIVGLLGILKAGGAYVPVDPTYPEERISYMLEDADCEIVLTQEHLELPKINSEIIYLDADWDKIENELVENVKSKVKSDNLAYVIYTSGSSGIPKGVMVSHKNMNLSLNARKCFYKEKEMTLLFQLSIAFDTANGAIFWSLNGGNKLVIVDSDSVNNPIRFINYIKDYCITNLTLTPSYYLQLLALSEFKDNSQSLKTVSLGGEPLTPNLLTKHHDNLGFVQLVNEYGPTEAVVWASAYICMNKKHKTIPIGKPIDNTQIYILDKNQKICPIGISGELCISGNGLSRGYLKKPELTAERFIKNPFSTDPNSRLYKTGDLARYLPDGNIEFIGRIDNQVKIRGYRIELGEIKASINKIETIEDCVVVAKEDTNGNKRLVAYIVSDDELNIQEIRDSLSNTLPDYMVPSLFVSLEKMPLTTNGKIDGKALPEPESNIETTNEYVAPQTGTEQKLADIWSKVLGVEKVGIYDNFIELGGHSLLATLVISRIRTIFNCEISPKILLGKSTLVELAKQIESTEPKGGLKNIQRFNTTKELELLDDVDEVDF